MKRGRVNQMDGEMVRVKGKKWERKREDEKGEGRKRRENNLESRGREEKAGRGYRLKNRI